MIFANAGISFVVGKGETTLQKICDVAKEAFGAGLKKSKLGSKKARSEKLHTFIHLSLLQNIALHFPRLYVKIWDIMAFLFA